MKKLGRYLAEDFIVTGREFLPRMSLKVHNLVHTNVCTQVERAILIPAPRDPIPIRLRAHRHILTIDTWRERMAEEWVVMRGDPGSSASDVINIAPDERIEIIPWQDGWGGLEAIQMDAQRAAAVFREIERRLKGG